ncbi:predicted protein [Uncinocarpus reesii 1704]|uniref:Neutral protease 2 n=1 Tax=Uncinocarpus reesii (strain UAMH 1704) TaxID=336963 RepID=C4JMZ0_UNCRE|nr:uncharacterized protein UREG_04198 [Uncinocarpus reesii 1704]EEP79352.1 predicted protein [Uncinocarpus reesii 1704]
MLLSILVAGLATFTRLASSAPHEPEVSVQLSRVDNTRIKAVLTNHAGLSISVLTPKSLFDPSPVQKVNVLKDDAFTTIAPNASLETTFDLAETFDLSANGQYTIYSDDFMLYGAANTTEIVGSVLYKSNELTIHVNGAKPALIAHAIVKRSTIDGTCRAYDWQLKAAFARCRDLAAGAARIPSITKFAEYFKTTEPRIQRIVAARFRAIQRECGAVNRGRARFNCKDSSGLCRKGYLAYAVTPGGQVFLCPSFHGLPMNGRSCHSQDKGHVVLHELTHLGEVYEPRCRDYAYSYEGIKRLGADKAYLNADTYGLYALAVLKGC